MPKTKTKTKTKRNTVRPVAPRGKESKMGKVLGKILVKGK